MVLDQREKKRMQHKFEICYVLAREGLAFLKYPVFHALAERQGVERCRTVLSSRPDSTHRRSSGTDWNSASDLEYLPSFQDASH